MTLLQTVINALDKALTVLKNHSKFGEDFAEIENGITREKEKIDAYKKAKGDEPYDEVVDWETIKEKE